MPGEVSKPPLGTPPSEGPRSDPIASDADVPIPPSPSTPSTSPSDDDLGLSPRQSRSDPILGEFAADAPPVPEVPGVEPPGSYDAVSVSVPDSGMARPSAIDSGAPRTSKILASLHLGHTEAPSARPESEKEDEEDDRTPRGASWLMVLLASYASAADDLKQKAREMTWRARLRTGIEKTDGVGVRSRDPAIRPGP